MPIYEYHCPECDNLFEEWCQRMDDEKSKPCPQCGKTAERIISHTSFALKGDGWYVTEYGSKKGINESADSNTPKSDNGSATTDNANASGAASSAAAKEASQSNQAPVAATASSTPSTPAS